MRGPGGGQLRTKRWLRRLGLLGVIGVLVTLLPASPAAAHGQLAMSVPARDSTVSEPLDSLLLYYTEKPPPNAYFTLTSPTGIRLDGSWSNAEPKQLDKPIQEYFIVKGVWEPRLYSTGFPVRLQVAYWPEQGLYTAHYLSVASDGEEVRGDVKFSYNGPTTAPPAGWQAPTNQPDPALVAAAEGKSGAPATTLGPTAGAKPQASSAGVSIWVWLLPASLLIGVGIILVRAGRRQPSVPGRPAKPAKATAKGKATATAAKGKAKGKGKGDGKSNSDGNNSDDKGSRAVSAVTKTGRPAAAGTKASRPGGNKRSTTAPARTKRR